MSSSVFPVCVQALILVLVFKGYCEVWEVSAVRAVRNRNTYLTCDSSVVMGIWGCKWRFYSAIYFYIHSFAPGKLRSSFGL